MKTFAHKFSSFAIAILLVSSVTLFTSCKKEKETNGKVTVVDESDNNVPDAEVVLSATSVNGEVTYTEITNSSGVADFEIGLPGIWDVTVTKTFDTATVKTGSGVLRLDEPGKKDDITVTIR